MPPKQLALLSSLVAVAMIYLAYSTSQRDPMVSAAFALGTTPAAPSKLPPEILVSYNDGIRLLLQLDMSYYKRAVFDVSFQAAALEGWCMHIGDSPGNDGWGGDDGRFSNNAEFQISGQGGAMALFGNDYLKEKDENAKGSMLEADLKLVGPRSRLTVTVKDGAIYWDNQAGGKKGGKESEFLFALKGQHDAKQGGPGDQIIFAAFNRLIGDAAQTGSCVSGVQVSLFQQ